MLFAVIFLMRTNFIFILCLHLPSSVFLLHTPCGRYKQDRAVSLGFGVVTGHGKQGRDQELSQNVLGLVILFITLNVI